MKCRNGFVSNSSSTSFVCYCFKTNGDELLKKLGYNEDTDDIYETIEAISMARDITIHGPYDNFDDDVLVGVEITSTYNSSFNEINLSVIPDAEVILENFCAKHNIDQTEFKLYVVGME